MREPKSGIKTDNVRRQMFHLFISLYLYEYLCCLVNQAPENNQPPTKQPVILPDTRTASAFHRYSSDRIKYRRPQYI
jgi:hypothetical protein